MTRVRDRGKTMEPISWGKQKDRPGELCKQLESGGVDGATFLTKSSSAWTFSKALRAKCGGGPKTMIPAELSIWRPVFASISAT